jgi:hypothetical protein
VPIAQHRNFGAVTCEFIPVSKCLLTNEGQHAFSFLMMRINVWFLYNPKFLTTVVAQIAISMYSTADPRDRRLLLDRNEPVEKGIKEAGPNNMAEAYSLLPMREPFLDPFPCHRPFQGPTIPMLSKIRAQSYASSSHWPFRLLLARCERPENVRVHG